MSLELGVELRLDKDILELLTVRSYKSYEN